MIVLSCLIRLLIFRHGCTEIVFFFTGTDKIKVLLPFILIFLSVLYATKSSEKVEELSKPTWSTKTSVLTWSLSKNFFPLRSQICFFLEYLTKTGCNYCSLLMLASEKFVRSSVTDFLVTATSHSHKIITGCLIYLSMNFV